MLSKKCIIIINLKSITYMQMKQQELGNGVVFVELSFLLDGLVAPIIAVFAQEPVAAHHKSLDEAVFMDGVEHVVGGRGAEVAAGAIYGGEHILVEVDE